MSSEQNAQPVLSAVELECIRGDRRLFHNLSLQLDSGALLHINGENGSGKSTLLRTLCGLYQPTAGEVLWNKTPIRQQRDIFNRTVFYFGHKPGIKEELSALENLRIASQMDDKPLNDSEALSALNTLGLYGFEDVPCKQLSQGQKRRAALARLCVTHARLWVLDEPFSALDSAACDTLMGIIAHHLAQGGMVLLTTHQSMPLIQGKVQRIALGSREHGHG